MTKMKMTRMKMTTRVMMMVALLLGDCMVEGSSISSSEGESFTMTRNSTSATTAMSSIGPIKLWLLDYGNKTTSSTIPLTNATTMNNTLGSITSTNTTTGNVTKNTTPILDFPGDENMTTTTTTNTSTNHHYNNNNDCQGHNQFLHCSPNPSSSPMVQPPYNHDFPYHDDATTMDYDNNGHNSNNWDSTTSIDILVAALFLIAAGWLILAIIYSVLILIMVHLRSRGELDIYDEHFGRLYLWGSTRCYIPLGWILRRHVIAMNARQAQRQQEGNGNTSNVTTVVRLMTREERRRAMEELFRKQQQEQQSKHEEPCTMRTSVRNSITTTNHSSLTNVIHDEEEECHSCGTESNNHPTNLHTKKTPDDRASTTADIVESSSLLGTADGDDNDQELCSICLMEYELDDVCFTSTTCSHVFHYDCILDWLQRRNHTDCPCCRITMVSDEDVWNMVQYLRREEKRRKRRQRQEERLRNRNHRTQNNTNTNNNNQESQGFKHGWIMNCFHNRWFPYCGGSDEHDDNADRWRRTTTTDTATAPQLQEPPLSSSSPPTISSLPLATTRTIMMIEEDENNEEQGNNHLGNQEGAVVSVESFDLEQGNNIQNETRLVHGIRTVDQYDATGLAMDGGETTTGTTATASMTMIDEDEAVCRLNNDDHLDEDDNVDEELQLQKQEDDDDDDDDVDDNNDSNHVNTTI